MPDTHAPGAAGPDVASYVARAEALAWQVDDVASETPTIPVERVGIIGAGTMGGGIAMNFASVGLPVTIVETRDDALQRGLATVRRNYEASASRGRFNAEEAQARIKRITGSLRMEDLADCNLVIEAVYEDLKLKTSIFARLDGIAKPGAILATNTSGLDVNEIAASTARPEAVIGLHFFSPANVMKLLEIVRGEKTSKRVIATAMQLARRIGKVAVLVGVCPGFVGNRMLYPRQLQANALLRQGLLPWDIDRAVHGFGFKMGPFEMSDLAGLDIGWTRGQTTGDPLRNALCEMDRRGQKTGAGYYDYGEDRRPHPSPVVEGLIREHVKQGGAARTWNETDIVEALIFPMINEGAKILGEGRAQRASDIDVVWLNGYGWPRDKGGPMYYANKLGLEGVLAKAAELGATDPFYKPAALLERLAAEGGRFAV